LVLLRIFISIKGLGLGLLSIYFTWRTQFRDPGILDPYLNYSSVATQDRFLYSNEEETTQKVISIIYIVFYRIVMKKS
jgi:hypothetical protein